MGYRETSHRTISGSTQVRYPMSKSGGSMTVNWSETINIVVHVNDDPFQHSVENLKDHIDGVTANIVATEAAQVATKYACAEQISNTMVQGFSGLIRSEIEQQMTELKLTLPPRFVEMQQFMVRFKALKEQMDKDFYRIVSRYQKLFSDLDTELKLRIGVLDQASFVLQKNVDSLLINKEASHAVAGASLGLREQSIAQNRMLTWKLRQRIMSMIQSTHRQVTASANLSTALKKIVSFGDATRALVYAPFLYYVADSEQGQTSHVIMAESKEFRSSINSHEKQVKEKMGDISDTRIWSDEKMADITDRIHAKILAASLCPRVAGKVRELLSNQQVAQIQGKQL